MDDDPGSLSRFCYVRLALLFVVVLCGSTLAALFDPGGVFFGVNPSTAFAQPDSDSGLDPDSDSDSAGAFTFPVVMAILALLFASGFFSASEAAFFSIHALRLRALKTEGGFTGRLVAKLMEQPGGLLTSILVGNMVVNVLISVMLPARVERLFSVGLHAPPALSYAGSLCTCTVILVFFGEITPKIFAERIAEIFARSVVLPLQLIHTALGPARWGLLHFTDFLFRVTRFNDIKAAPFITDEEFRSVLSDSEAQGVIEEEEGQMIQAILEFSDAHVKEILIPRPDVIALSQDATIGEAIILFREHGFSRMPVFEEDLDHISGLLVMKDLLPSITQGDLDRPARELARVPRYVPESMTIHRFVKDAQKTRTHLAIVVDEYGGTEGLVSLEDALEQVVGPIQNEDVEEETMFDELRQGVYQVDGGLPLDELSELIGVELKDEEHETVAGFFIDKANRLPEPGDRVEHRGVVFIVEKVDGKRVSSLRVETEAEPQREPTS